MEVSLVSVTAGTAFGLEREVDDAVLVIDLTDTLVDAHILRPVGFSLKQLVQLFWT